MPEKIERRRTPKEGPPTKKIITGAVEVRKESGLAKVKKSFISEDFKDIGNYILFDLIIPGVKDLVWDMVQGGIERTLYGDRVGPARNRRGGSRGYVNYSGYSGGPQRGRTVQRTESFRFDDIVLENRHDAEMVLAELDETIEQYGVATVYNLYDLVGKTGEYTDNHYGWESIAKAKVSRVHGGYLLDLPQPRPI